MSSEHPDEEQIFRAAFKIASESERQAYLKQACGENEALLNRVEVLLQALTGAGDFLESAAEDFALTLEESTLTELPGTVIGRYTLLEKIGEGGMAVVYMAEQKQPIRRRVALKLIKPGMDSKQVIARFETERQALALMDHPNIAKVLDAGATETGRPYFVMELVKGISITEFCEKSSLNTQTRLELLIAVCQAVHHAHQRGIIHRDIKPSNVMVTLHDGVPVPKVIDFGIAKAVNQQLTEKTVFTCYAQMIGTPEYMSPEQAEMSGLNIDIRTDVFSLGVLLYELLTGTTPFDSEYLLSRGYAEIQRIIREEEPAKPSTKVSTLGKALAHIAKSHQTSPDMLCKLLRPELDWITMKTLEKDRNRRYDSVSELAADIRRHINREPVMAGPPSAFYRIKKFAQRRKTLVVATGIVLIAILLALVFSIFMYVRAEQARHEESAARFETQLVSDFFTEDLLASVFPENAKGQEVTVRYLLDRAAENIDQRLEGSPLSEAKVRETIGLAYQKLGDYNAAEPHLQRALQIRCEQLGEDDSTTLVSLSHLGNVYTLQCEYEKAETVLKNALATRIRVLGDDHPDTLESMAGLGQLHVYRANYKEAYPLLAQVQQIGKGILGSEHPIVLNAMLGNVYLFTYSFQHERAYLLARKGLEISRRSLGEEHEITLGFMKMFANCCREKKYTDDAEDLFTRALEVSQRVLGQEHPNTIDTMARLGDLHRNEGRYVEAAPLLTMAMELGRYELGWGHVWTLLCAMRLTRFYEVQEQYDQMEEIVVEALKKGCPLQGNRQLSGWFKWKLHGYAANLTAAAKKQYDAGSYDAAVRIMTHQAELRQLLPSEQIEVPPADVALHAMSLWRLDHYQEAITRLRRLRQMYDQNQYVHEVRYLYEAEQVLASNNGLAYQAWCLIEERELGEASRIIERLKISVGDVDLEPTTQSLTNALVRAYYIRGYSAEGRSKYYEAIADYEVSLQINPGFAPSHNRLASLLSICQVKTVRDAARAMEHAAQACQLSEWKDATYLSTLAAAHAEAADYGKAVKYQTQAVELLSQNEGEGSNNHFEMRLRLYESGKPYHRSMIAWWTFERSSDKIVYDASDNSLDGTLTGGAIIVADRERLGSVLALDGEGDWVDCGNSAKLSVVSQITVACWVKIRKFDKIYHTIISKGNNAWRLALNGRFNAVEFACSGITGLDNTSGSVYGTMTINDGQWHHLVGVYDGTRICLYVDGELEASGKAYGTIKTDLCKVLVGENYDERTGQGSGRFFNGFIDDVLIFDYALTGTDIKALYTGEGLNLISE
jgi:eukaryotic-like serine/threonine-protein kinase